MDARFPMLGLMWQAHSMDGFEADGRVYKTTRASDVVRDGMTLELEEVALEPGRGILAEAFWHDPDGRFTFTVYDKDPLPFALVEWFVTKARHLLPPAAEAASAADHQSGSDSV